MRGINRLLFGIEPYETTFSSGGGSEAKEAGSQKWGFRGVRGGVFCLGGMSKQRINENKKGLDSRDGETNGMGGG